MKQKTKVLIALSLLVCSCATKYGEEGFFSNGYADFRCSEDTFVITFKANEYTKSGKVMQYALYRASEVTLQHGYSYFTIIDQSDTTRSSFSISSGTVSKHHFPSLCLTIKCFIEKPSDPNAIDAEKYLNYNLI